MHTYTALHEVYDVIANSDNKTPEGYLLDSVGSLFNMVGIGPKISQRHVTDCVSELVELGVIVSYDYTISAALNTYGRRRTVRLMKVLVSDFSWDKFLELTHRDIDILDKEDIERMIGSM